MILVLNSLIRQAQYNAVEVHCIQCSLDELYHYPPCHPVHHLHSLLAFVLVKAGLLSSRLLLWSCPHSCHLKICETNVRLYFSLIFTPSLMAAVYFVPISPNALAKGYYSYFFATQMPTAKLSFLRGNCQSSPFDTQ